MNDVDNGGCTLNSNERKWLYPLPDYHLTQT